MKTSYTRRRTFVSGILWCICCYLFIIFFTFNVSIIKFCYFSFFRLVGKQSIEKTQSNQFVKEIRNKTESFMPTYEWEDVEEG